MKLDLNYGQDHGQLNKINKNDKATINFSIRSCFYYVT